MKIIWMYPFPNSAHQQHEAPNQHPDQYLHSVRAGASRQLQGKGPGTFCGSNCRNFERYCDIQRRRTGADHQTDKQTQKKS